jgi:hypothetical protein
MSDPRMAAMLKPSVHRASSGVTKGSAPLNRLLHSPME